MFNPSKATASCSTKQVSVGKKIQSVKTTVGREKNRRLLLGWRHRTQIESGEIVVLFLDECHLAVGDDRV